MWLNQSQVLATSQRVTSRSRITVLNERTSGFLPGFHRCHCRGGFGSPSKAPTELRTGEHLHTFDDHDDADPPADHGHIRSSTLAGCGSGCWRRRYLAGNGLWVRMGSRINSVWVRGYLGWNVCGIRHHHGDQHRSWFDPPSAGAPERCANAAQAPRVSRAASASRCWCAPLPAS